MGGDAARFESWEGNIIYIYIYPPLRGKALALAFAFAFVARAVEVVPPFSWRLIFRFMYVGTESVVVVRSYQR